MKSSIIKSFAATFLFLSVAAVPAFSAPQDSIPSRYDRHLEKYILRWNKLIPDYSKLQFAGGMGVLSLGFGWDYGRHRQWETDILFGYLPRFSGDRGCGTFTLKQNYIPWKIPLGGRWSLEPLETGLYMNKLMSRDFWTREPDKYGGPYYRFATNLRFSAFLGQRVTVQLGKQALHRSLTFFYEFSSNDLYIISAFTNRTLKLDDILVLSFGVKFQIF